MNLKINKKQLISRIIWSVLGLLLAIFVIRVVVWENQYYASKEGSERVVVEKEEEPEVDETEVSEQQITEYTVAPDRPRYITIEKLGVYNARVISVGLKANSELGTPNNIFDVGWYDSSSKPGEGGTLLLDGHNGGPTKIGVFKYLGSVAVGDIIKIERGDGTIFNYKTVENVAVPLDEADAYMANAIVSPEPGKESVSIITCAGDWSDERKTYLSRQFLRAVIVE